MAAQAYGYLINRAQFGTSDLHPFGAPATDVLLHALRLAPNQRVLEIGCGTATTLVRVAAAVPLAIEGVDLLPAMLAVGRQRIRLAGLQGRARLVRANASAGLPFASGVYARIYTESVLGLASAEQAHTFLREIFRVLKPGGRYVANEAIWKPGVDAATAAALHAAELRDFGVGQASAQSWALGHWIAAMSAAGFTIEATPQLTPEYLAEHAAHHSAPRRSFRTAQALMRARLVTWGYRGLSSLHADRRQAQLIYRRHEQAHQDDGRALEGRLFILAKPE